MSEPAGIRGESAYLIETPDEYLAHVEEGLGTKNLIADAMLQLTGRSFYRNIGIDTVATIVNDLITTGAAPISVAMHAAVGDAAWFTDPRRSEELAAGFAEGCRQAGAVWGGGETPTLRGIVNPETIVLAGSAIGRIRPKSLRITGQVRDGDAMIFLASSGVQTNGLTLCRRLADSLDAGIFDPHLVWRASLRRRTAGSIGDLCPIYCGMQSAGVNVRYAVHVTGHGWRKLMRLDEPFVYEVNDIRTEQCPKVFDFICRTGPVATREAFATFNMGVGFAVYVDPGDERVCLLIAKATGYSAWRDGPKAGESESGRDQAPPDRLTGVR